MKILLCSFALLVTCMPAMSQTQLERALKSGNDQFTADMFQEVVKLNGGKSCVLSAFSVLSPLAQLALASEGESHDEILRTIGFSNDNVTKDVFTDVNSRLASVKGVELKQANKVYIRNGYSLNDDFAALSKKIFNSEVQNIDFIEREKAASAINAWVEDHTNKRIKDLVSSDSINSDTVAILVNAIYFKGKWKKPFLKSATEDRDFYINKDKKVSIPTMYQSDSFRYGESEELDAQFLEMKYDGEETSMLIALPKKVDGLNALIEKIKDPAVLNKAIENMHSQEVYVYLPKFKIETTTNLKTVLEKMNIKKLFKAGEARLENLLKEAKDLYVSDATQKAFIEVNEEGAEAAAANHFNVHTRSGKIVLRYAHFKADRPFYYALKYNDVVLFNGLFYS